MAQLNPNAIAFTGLANEYCQAVENARGYEQGDFVRTMLKLLPRLYITASDLTIDDVDEFDAYIDPALEEDYYDSVRRNMEEVFGEDDIYLEVFEEDMKFSDTPVSASISEGLADIFQVLYNYLATVRDTTDETVKLALVSVRDDFKSYWSSTLCNVLRALNAIAVRE
ncbi:MAG: DUF5063 domain-containing protein [Bacteroidales bacterium]|nr:DUF5063 domain-containing protein [Bacteroidales bacterium]MBD5235376.1 DUF5063 domain-containing protein [Barnesiella sp.]